MITWRPRDGDEEDGPPIEGNAKVQLSWIAITSVIVLALFVFGTVELVVAERRRARARDPRRSGSRAASRWWCR